MITQRKLLYFVEKFDLYIIICTGVTRYYLYLDNQDFCASNDNQINESVTIHRNVIYISNVI
jgi:hypothetical protein